MSCMKKHISHSLNLITINLITKKNSFSFHCTYMDLMGFNHIHHIHYSKM